MKSLAIIDVQQLFLSCREEFGPLARLDFVKLKELFKPSPGDIVDAMAYVLASPYHDDKNFLRFLKKNGYYIMRKFAQLENKPSATKEVRFKNKPWTEEMCWDAIRVVHEYEQIFIVSGNGAFCPVVASAHEKNKKVTVVSFKNSLQDTLKTTADNVVILDKSYIFDANIVKAKTAQPFLQN